MSALVIGAAISVIIGLATKVTTMKDWGWGTLIAMGAFSGVVFGLLAGIIRHNYNCWSKKRNLEKSIQRFDCIYQACSNVRIIRKYLADRLKESDKLLIKKDDTIYDINLKNLEAPVFNNWKPVLGMGRELSAISETGLPLVLKGCKEIICNLSKLIKLAKKLQHLTTQNYNLCVEDYNACVSLYQHLELHNDDLLLMRDLNSRLYKLTEVLTKALSTHAAEDTYKKEFLSIQKSYKQNTIVLLRG